MTENTTKYNSCSSKTDSIHHANIDRIDKSSIVHHEMHFEGQNSHEICANKGQFFLGKINIKSFY